MNTDAFVSHDNIASFRDDKENHYPFKNWEQRKLPSRTQRGRWGCQAGTHWQDQNWSTPVFLGSDGNVQVGSDFSLVICLYVVRNSSGIMSEIRSKRWFHGNIQAYVWLPKELCISTLPLVSRMWVDSSAPLYAKVLFVIERKWSQ